ncbi:alpha/beta hydrolase fold domain-containing protein [Nocardia suismassiliense]|uniref:Alpha/beta hydrolase fold domain-containing protein n=1 Tax=Nocardia suismassiliense TaxID=2077092 RepID=A0ABW6R0D3_9NOCA
MAQMNVPTEIRTRTTTLGTRPAVLVEPAAPPRSGTILYFHGGGWVYGSPQTAMSLTANLVTRTGCVLHHFGGPDGRRPGQHLAADQGRGRARDRGAAPGLPRRPSRG